MQDDKSTDLQQENNQPEESEQVEGENTQKNEEASTIGSDIIRGHINTIILRALYERDKYGYEIMNDIESKSHGQYSLKQPTLYSALKRLENQGYIKAYWKTDEVSSGGRRKYFTLTESGKEITEKNLAEWEYSRTIIDSLISDRSFDFSQPAPTPVDFTILRNSVSRVPIVRSEEATTEGKHEEATEAKTEEKHEVDEKVTENSGEQRVVVVSEQPATEQVIERTTVTEQVTEQVVQSPSTTVTEQVVQEQIVEQVTNEQAVNEQTSTVSEQNVSSSTQQETGEQEARRIAHENYLRLISEPVRVEQPAPEDVVPNHENMNTDSLLYNNRPETERDYKNLIDGIFNRAISNGSEQYVHSEPIQPPPAPKSQSPRIVRLAERGRADGVAISSSGSDSDSTYATRTTYDKGLTLFKCSSIVLGIIILEFIFSFIFVKQLNTNWGYPVVILALGLIQFAVFGILALKGYDKHCVRPTTNNYISTCVILTIISILIICALAFVIGMNPNSAGDIFKMIVIPSITVCNVTVFAVCFKAFLNK